MRNSKNTPIRGAAVLMLAATLSLLSHACSKSPQTYLEAGKKYLEEDRYNEALIEFRNAINKDSRFAEAHYQMGLLYMRLGAWPQALQEMQATVGSDQNRMDVHIRIGNLLLIQRKYGEAREKAEWIIDKTPENLEARILEANSWAGMIHINDSIHEMRASFEQEPRLMSPFISFGADAGIKLDAGKAEELYMKIVDSNGSQVAARLALGNFYLMKGRDSEAGTQYEAAAQNDPQSRDAVFALGYFYLQGKMFTEAEEQYNKYVELGKDITGIEVVLPDFYLASGETDRGILTLEKMAADNPEIGVFKKRLASIYFDRRDFDKAEVFSDELIKKDAGDATAHYLKGRILLTQNKGAEAVSHLRIVVAKRPGYAPARYFLGAAYLQNGDTSKAASELEIAVDIDPALSQAQLSLAKLKLEAGNTDEAIEIAQKVLNRNPGLDEARLILGSAFVAQKDYRAAAPELQAFVKNNPNNPVGMVQLGFLYMVQGNAASAETQFEAALEIDPDNLSAATELARLYISQNRQDNAIQRLNQMLERNPQLTRIHEILGQVYLNQRDFISAEAEYKKAVAAEPENAGLQIGMAQFYQNAGHAEKGVATLEDFIKANPADIAARVQLARMFMGRKDYDKAFTVAGEALKTNNKDIDALMIRGQILMMQNKALEAIRTLQDAVTAAPTSQEARYLLGLAAQQSGDRARAEQEWMSAAEKGSRFVPLYLALSRLKLDAGDADAAVTYSRKALELNPSELEARRTLGRAFTQKRDYANAVAELEKYLHERPSDAAVLYNLGQAYRAQGNFTAAEDRFNSVIEANPNQTAALTALVDMYVSQKQPDKAIQKINHESKRGLDAALSHNLLGHIYIGRNDHVKAEQELQQAASLDPKNPAYRQALAEFYITIGNAGKAEEILQKMVEENSKNMDVRKRLINLYISQNGMDKAFRLIDATLRTNPKETEIRLLKADILMEQNRFAESVREIQTAIENDRNSKQAQYMLGMAYIRDKKESQSESAFNAAVKIDPKFIPAWRALVQLKLSGGNMVAAIQYARDALRADPSAVDMRLLLAEGFIGRKSYKDAITELEAYVGARPTDVRGLYRLGTAYMEDGNDAKAESVLLSALERNPGGIEPLSALVSMDLRRKQPERAISRINTQIQKAPQAAGFYELLGRTYADQGNAAKAEGAFRKQASMDGSRTAGSINLASFLISRESYDAAIDELQNIISENPKSGEAHTLLGAIYEKLKDDKKAMEHYRTALENNPNQALAANNLAFLLAETGGDMKEAEQLAQQARKQLPDSLTTADTLAWIYYKRGAYSSAIDMLRDCIKHDPKNAIYLYHLGMAYSKNGNQAQAKEALTQALDLNPDMPQASEISSILETLQ